MHYYAVSVITPTHTMTIECEDRLETLMFCLLLTDRTNKKQQIVVTTNDADFIALPGVKTVAQTDKV